MTFSVVNVLWPLFRADTVQQWLDILHTITGFSNTTVSDGLLDLFKIQESGVLFNTFPIIKEINDVTRGFRMIVFIFISSAICFFPENNYKNLKRLSWAGMMLAAVAAVWGITCLGSETTFVYFGF